MQKLKSSERKLVKHGNSVHVSIPISELRYLNLEVGDTVSVTTTDEGILIKPTNKIEIPPNMDIAPNFFKEMEQIMSQHDETFKGLVDR